MRILVYLIIGLTGALCSSFAADWHQFLGPNRNGISSETGLKRNWSESGPKLLWSVTIGDGFGGAAIRDSEVYVLDRIVGKEDVMRCFDLETGKELWRYANKVPGRLPYPGSRGVPLVEENRVYGISGFGYVYCIDRNTRKLVWSMDIKIEYNVEPPRFGFAQSPLIYKNLLIIAPMSGEVGLTALDKSTGEEVWRSKAIGYGFSTPTVNRLNGDQLIFQTILDRSSQSGLVTSFDPLTGNELWKYRDYYVMCPIPGAVTISDNSIFLTGGYEAGSIMLSLNTEKDTGYRIKKRFHVDKGSQIHEPILYKDHLYMIVNENANQKVKSKMKEGGLLCMDLQGNIKWRTGKSPNFGRGSIILADGMLIIQDGHNGTLRLVQPNPERYIQLAEANVFGITDSKDHQMWAPMALSNGKLVMRSQTEMKCLNLSRE